MEKSLAELIADPYAVLGVQRFINCCGTRTVHGGSLMPGRVRQAMEAAATSFVHVPELLRRAGAFLAPLLGAEAALITSGAAASLTAATAGALSRRDPERMLRLPSASGFPNRVIAPGSGRFAYDQAIRAAGAEIVSVADEAALEQALHEPIAMFVMLGTQVERQPLTLRRLAEIAKQHDVPVLVDAASERLALPSPYLAMGASMVAFSGGKYLTGPQSTGLLFGDARWIDAAWWNAAPHHAIGRAMKVSKEEIVGLVAAVLHLVEARTAAAEEEGWREDLARIAAHIDGLAGVRTRVLEPGRDADPSPRLVIEWTDAVTTIDGLELRARLLEEAEPAIMLDDRACHGQSVQILPFNLRSGEAEIVGARIAASLSAASRAPCAADPPPATDLGGVWQVEIAFAGWRARHRFDIQQRGAILSGEHYAAVGTAKLSGRIAGIEVELASLVPLEGTSLSYCFRGRAACDSMDGEVELGTSGQSAPGPLNQREFGSVRFQATRIEASAAAALPKAKEGTT